MAEAKFGDSYQLHATSMRASVPAENAEADDGKTITEGEAVSLATAEPISVKLGPMYKLF